MPFGSGKASGIGSAWCIAEGRKAGIVESGSMMSSVATVNASAASHWSGPEQGRRHSRHPSRGRGTQSALLAGAWRVHMRAIALLLSAVFVVVLAGYANPETRLLTLSLTPGLVWLASMLVTVPALADGGRRFALWAGGTGGFLLLLEAAAVNSAAIYGTYSYGPALGFSWRGVPLVVAVNWAILVHGSVSLACWSVPSRAGAWRTPVILLLTGLGAMVFALVAEPAASEMGFWTWGAGMPPTERILAGPVIAVLAGAMHPRRTQTPSEVDSAGRLAAVYVVLQMAFFLALHLV